MRTVQPEEAALRDRLLHNQSEPSRTSAGFGTSFVEEKAFLIDGSPHSSFPYGRSIQSPIRQLGSLSPVGLGFSGKQSGHNEKKRYGRSLSLSLSFPLSRNEASGPGTVRAGWPERRGWGGGVDSGRIRSPGLSVIQKQAWHRCGSLPSFQSSVLSYPNTPHPHPDPHTDASQPEMTVTTHSSPYYSCHIIPVSTSPSSPSSPSVRMRSVLLFT
ncbi:unnamed protein product [Tetraodon nigroviridis]|uniref:Chromosome 10 SCAF15019, whole genome shotgun sequence n=1 Tax=Tetraodon nigroviridis TaxID=99883 RepID=Q4RMQ0_TETNG|nr:unnamed protein product [Tetraodon nigroviridis]